MYFNKFLPLVFFIIVEIIHYILSSNTSEITLNHFANNTVVFEDLLNELFGTLKLNKQIIWTTSNQLLVTMHDDLMNIAENSYKTSQLENVTDNGRELAKHYAFDKVLEDITLIISDNATRPRDTMNKLMSVNLSLDASKLFKKFIFVFEKENMSSTNVDKKKFNKFSRRRLNLKTWVPAPDSGESTHNHNLTLGTRRIYKGQATSIKRYPFVASIHVGDEFVCAGSIIWRGLVLTAASCLQVAYVHRNYGPPENVTIRIGKDTTTEGKRIRVTEIFFNPYYNPESLNHNLAILKMGNHKLIKTKTIRKILYDRSSDPFPSEMKYVKILGWGAQDATNKPNSSVTLASSYLDLYDKKKCIKIYSKYYVVDSNFCAGFTTKGGGACSKDVGDPAIVEGVLVGVTSFGPPLCGTPDAPTVFTQVGIYAPWIDDIIYKLSTSGNKRAFKNMQNKKSLKYSSEVPNRNDNSDYPQEIHVIKEILKEIARENQSEIEQLIYEGLNESPTELPESTETSKEWRGHEDKSNREHFSAKKPSLKFRKPTSSKFKKEQSTKYTPILHTDDEYASKETNERNFDIMRFKTSRTTKRSLTTHMSITRPRSKRPISLAHSKFKKRATTPLPPIEKKVKVKKDSAYSNYEYEHSKETTVKKHSKFLNKVTSDESEYSKESTVKKQSLVSKLLNKVTTPSDYEDISEETTIKRPNVKKPSLSITSDYNHGKDSKRHTPPPKSDSDSFEDTPEVSEESSKRGRFFYTSPLPFIPGIIGRTNTPKPTVANVTHNNFFLAFEAFIEGEARDYYDEYTQKKKPNYYYSDYKQYNSDDYTNELFL